MNLVLNSPSKNITRAEVRVDGRQIECDYAVSNNTLTVTFRESIKAREEIHIKLIY